MELRPFFPPGAQMWCLELQQPFCDPEVGVGGTQESFRDPGPESVLAATYF